MAMAPDGGVLISDDQRDQILEWHNGAVRVVAGDGLEGFGGDGGQATNAELGSPGEIAMAPNGSIDFVDGENHRIRSISPQGIITTIAGGGSGGDGGPATSATLTPDGVAVAQDGTLYISSGSSIQVVSPGGVLSTLVGNGPPYGVDVSVGGQPIAFDPGALAVEGDGDVVAADTSPKVLFVVSPSGTVTQIATDYVTSLSADAGGSVLVGLHGPGLQKLVGTTLTTVPTRFPLVADGVAAAPDGTIYTDAAPGDGYNDQVGLYTVNPIDGGGVVAAHVDGPGTASLPSLRAPAFDGYPAPGPSSDPEALPDCPAMDDVVPFTPAEVTSARLLLGGWGNDFSYDLHASDRAWWARDIATFTAGDGLGIGRLLVGKAQPASGTLYATAIAASCGTSLLHDSEEVTLTPSPYDRSVEHVYLLTRGGTPLVYFVAW
jgi:hypothetical protein